MAILHDFFVIYYEYRPILYYIFRY